VARRLRSKFVTSRLLVPSTNVHRDDEKKYFYLTRHALQNPADNILCPVKWILVLALRSGNVIGHDRSVSDIISRANGRHDKQVLWRHPNRPVLCASGGAIAIDFDKLMPRTRANAILAHALRVMGTDVHMTPHSMRFGAADDLQIVAPETKGMVSERGVRSLCHTEACFSDIGVSPPDQHLENIH
jgi:hypothetical protein